MAASAHAPSARPRRPRGGALASVVLALMLTLLLEALDQTIVGTAMPRIIGQLRGLDRYTWVVTAYLLASTALLPVASKLSDQFGRKWFLLGGTATFLVGSALCGLAQTIDELIVFRAVQGAGAGVGIALVYATVGDLFPPVERGKWQGVVNSVYALSSVAGPTLGGWLADHGPLLGALVTDASRWRWVFFINLPLGTAALAVLLVALPTGRPSHGVAAGWAALRRVDALGAAVAAGATLCLLVGLTWAGEGAALGGAPRVLGALAAAGVLYAALLFAERHAVEPILPLHLFRDGRFAADLALSLMLNMTLLGMAVYVPLYLQGVLGASATQSGAAMTPFSVGIAVASAGAGVAISALRRYRVISIAGALTMAVGVLLLTHLTPMTTLPMAALYVATAGLGMGALYAVVTGAALTTLPAAHLGAGMGAVRYVGQIGLTTGAAIVGAVVNHSLAGELAQRLPGDTSRRLTADGVAVAANAQSLVSPSYRQTVAEAAVRDAAAQVPPGPQHALLVQIATAHAHDLLAQAFDAIRLSLAGAIHRGLIADLAFALATVLAACSLGEMPAPPAGDESGASNTNG